LFLWSGGLEFLLHLYGQAPIYGGTEKGNALTVAQLVRIADKPPDDLVIVHTSIPRSGDTMMVYVDLISFATCSYDGKNHTKEVPESFPSVLQLWIVVLDVRDPKR
jgi:hypothetical protein